MGPRKKSNYMGDLLHWAELSGVRISPKARDLLKSDARPPLRAALVAKDSGRLREFHHPAYRARWCDGRDLSQPEVLRELLSDAGLDGDEALARSLTPELDERLDRETRQAIERGVFGVPTLFVNDHMFWGNDRLELVRFYLEK